MADVLMAFLGATDYRTFRYRFSDLEDAAVTARYAATATMCYLKKVCGVKIGRLIVAGTVSSFWDKLPEYLSEKAEDMLADASGAETAKAVLDSEKTKEICAALADCRQKRSDAANFPGLLTRLEQELNAAFGHAGLAVSLLEHPEDFSRYESQIDLLNTLQRMNVIQSGSTVHLDITNGLRIMPFAVFADFQCLCRISGFKIGRVFYLPEPKFPTEPVERLDAIESIKARLRALKKRDPAAYQEKLAGIKSVLDAEKSPSAQNSSGANVPAAGPVESRVCTLDISRKLLDDAFMMEQFKVSLDPAVFRPALSGAPNASELKKHLEEMSYQLNTGLYADAAAVAEEHEQAIVDAFRNPEISAMLEKFLSWTDDFDPNDYLKAAEALKKLTASYLNCGNYPQAINSLYYAVYNYEHPSTTGDMHDQLQKEAIHSHYSSAIDKFKTFREMLIHLNDISDAPYKKGNPERKKLLKAIKPKDDTIDTDDLPQKLKNNLKMFGIKKVNSPDLNEHKHTLITFIGSGEYGTGSYSYCNPFHPEDCDYDISSSKMIGVSLAARMRDYESEHLSKVLVCGTWTSNWRIVLKTLEKEFLSLMPAGRQEEFLRLESAIISHQNAAGDAAISQEDIDSFNRFFESIAEDIGCRFVMIVTSADIADTAGQHQMLEAIRNELSCGDLLSFDITHSYRIIPVLALCFAQYFHATLDTRLQHIFYGDMPLERDLNMLNGLKKSQMKDDETFARTCRRIEEEILKDATASLGLNGRVYEMKNIAKLMEYSSAISRYATTGNLMFLKPMMKVELKKRDPDAYFCFINSAFLKNFTLTKNCCDYLRPALAALSRSIEDPVLKVLKKQILKNLQRLPLDDNWEYSGDLSTVTIYHADEADFYLDGGNIMMALLHCYEGMVNVGLSVLRNKEKDPMTNSLLEQTNKQNGTEQVTKIIKMYNTQKTKKEKAASQMTRAVFGNQIWYAVANRRNAVFHNSADKQNDSGSRALANRNATREAIQKAIKSLRDIARKFADGPEAQSQS